MSTLRIFLFILIALNALAYAGIQGWLGSTAPRTEPERLANQLSPERIRLATDASGQGLLASTPNPEVGTAPLAEPALAPASPEEAVSAADSAIEPALPAAATSTATETASPPNVSTEPTAPAEQPETRSATTTPSATAPPPAPLRCVAWNGLSQADADALVRRLRRIGAEPERSKVETPNSWWVRIPPQANREQAERRVQELRAQGVSDVFIVQDAGPTQYAISLGVFKTEGRARQLLNQLRNQGVRNAGIEARMSTTYRIQADLATDAVRGVESGIRGLAGQRSACNRP